MDITLDGLMLGFSAGVAVTCLVIAVFLIVDIRNLSRQSKELTKLYDELREKEKREEGRGVVVEAPFLDRIRPDLERMKEK